MKRFNNLFEKIVTFKNLNEASKKAFMGNKKYTVSGQSFYFNLEKELISLEKELSSEEYQPGPYYHFSIYDPKYRDICAASFRDRVVHHAICNIIEPLFNQTLIYDTYACIKGKGSHAAVKRAQTFSKKFNFVLKCDINSYFETVDHEVLLTILSRKIKDKRLMRLLKTIIKQPFPKGSPGKGLPIGNLTSQIFANIYLGQLDHLVKDQLAVKGYLRYMDDFLVFEQDKSCLIGWLYEIDNYVTNKLLIELKENVLKLMPVSQGVPFLGFRIFPGIIRLQRKNVVRFRRKMRKREHQFLSGEIDEKNFIDSVTSILAHISHADTYKMRQSFIKSLSYSG